MFKIKTAFALLFSFVILFLLIILFALLGLFQNRKVFGESQIGQFQSISLSDQLRERNDDLTHYCLNFIITGDTLWEKRYWECTESSLYRFPSKQQGFKMLEDSLRNFGYTKTEFDILKKAIDLSVELNKMELKAIAITRKGLKNDSKIHIEQHREEALKVISSDAYFVIKRQLIANIVDFENRIQDYTNNVWKQNIKQGLSLYRGSLVLIGLAIVVTIIAFILIFKRVAKEAQKDALFKEGVKQLERTQKELLKSDERFTLAVEGSGARIWDYRIEEKELYWSPPNLHLLDYSPEEIKPDLDFLLSLMHIDDRNKFKTLLEQHVSEGVPFNVDFRFIQKNGELRWCRCRGNSSRQLDGSAKRVVGIFIDITDRVKAEERATNAILETEDKERSRIARDIHDSLQQTMSTALLNFEKVRSSLQIEDKMLAEKFNIGYQYLKKAIGESRTLAHNLMPKVVDKNGVTIAIQSLIGALKGSTSTEILFYHNLNKERLNLAVEMTFYRIVQEAVNNVIKYAQANECTIQLLKHEGTVTLTIEDDGKGFEIEKMNDTFGLNSMKTRALAIGAFFQIDSSPKRGTQILIELSI